MASLSSGGSCVHIWEHQQQSSAFVMLDPSWWGYILGSFLPGSSLYTLKQVCKAWRELTASPYYTAHAPLRITTKLLGRLTYGSSSRALCRTEQRLNILKQVCRQCGGRICLGLPRTAVEFHGVVIELLEVADPVQQITVSLDTRYVPVVGALHRLLLRSTETLVDLKLRGARVAQQLWSFLETDSGDPAAGFDDNASTAINHSSTTTSNNSGTSKTFSCSSKNFLLLPQLRNLETDNVYLLRVLHAPKLLSLFVDYNSGPSQIPPVRELSQRSERSSINDSTTSDTMYATALSDDRLETACRWLSEGRDVYSRLVLLEFLGRSGSCLQRLTQAAILPVWSYPREDETLLQNADACALVQRGISLPNLRELSLSDVGLLVHLNTVNLSVLALELPQVAVLPILFQRRRQQQLTAQLQELVLQLPSHKAVMTTGMLDDKLSYSAACPLYKRIDRRLRSSPFPASSYSAIGLSLHCRSRRILADATETDEDTAGITPACVQFEAPSWERGNLGGRDSVPRASVHGALYFSNTFLQNASPNTLSQSAFTVQLLRAVQQQQQAKADAPDFAGQSTSHPQHLTERQRRVKVTIFPQSPYKDCCGTNISAEERPTIRPGKHGATADPRTSVKLCSTKRHPFLSISGQEKARMSFSAADKALAVFCRRHRTWTPTELAKPKAEKCSSDVCQGWSIFECMYRCVGYGLTCAGACSSGDGNRAADFAASDDPVALADSLSEPSPVVVLLNLTHLTAPSSLLGLLVCPNLRQLHVIGIIHRLNVLNFLRAAAPLTECLLIEKLHNDFKVERREVLPETQEKTIGTGGKKAVTVCGDGETVVTWKLLQLKMYKGPAALMSDDVECPVLEDLEATDEDTTGELSRFLFARRNRCPRLRRLSVKSFCPPASAQAWPGTHGAPPSCRQAADTLRTELTIQGELIPKKGIRKRKSSAFSHFIPNQGETPTCAAIQQAASRMPFARHRGFNLQNSVQRAPSRNSLCQSTSKVRPSWFDHPFATKLHANFSSNHTAGLRSSDTRDEACVFSAAGAPFDAMSASPSIVTVTSNDFQSRSSSRQCTVQALRVSRLNARLMVDWLPVAPGGARLLLMHVKELYVDRLEEGRRALARLLSVLPMLEYVEIQCSPGMTEKFVEACFAFRGFHACSKHLVPHQGAGASKQAPQWCFVKQAVRKGCTGEAEPY